MLQKMVPGSLVLLVLVCVSTVQAEVNPESGKQVAAELDTMIPIKMNYQIYLPDGYQQQEKWPLLLFLHGAGERGDNLDLVTVHGPPKLIKNGKQFPLLLSRHNAPRISSGNRLS